MMELLGKSREQLQAYAKTLGAPAYRGAQIYHALYAERKFEVARFTNLPVALRDTLRQEATVTLPVVRQRYRSSDGSVRYLFGLSVGKETSAGISSNAHRKPAAVEAVFMPSERRQTICVSTQAGCAVDCQFCLTAKLGLIRNLTAGEILAQVLLPLVEMGGKESERDPPGHGGAGEESSTLAARTNVVLMGQGEPLLNFENVMAALRILLDPQGVGLSPKRVTLSTSGVVPGIARLAKEGLRPKLAISLNASCDEQRDRLMPINKKYPLEVLVEACRRYPLRNWEHLTFEYVMLGGVNDTAEDARRVVKLLAPLDRVKVNLIPWNPGELPYKESNPDKISRFQGVLTEQGVPAFVRYSRGRDVMAACGQLALQEVQHSPLPILG
jgi:23S rRNA (adenine2503-C2)-methyltransferase